MTREQLITLANDLHNYKYQATKLYSCTAWVLETDIPDVWLLKSYNTIVAVYSAITGTVYVFDYYSNTTSQHIRKFAKYMDADRLTYLYETSSRIYEQAVSPYANTHKGNKATFDNLKACDWSTIIENKAFER